MANVFDQFDQPAGSPIIAQSADGVLHQFPAGTDQAVIDRTMKAYAAGNQSRYDLPTLEGALRRADAAGDTDGARALAQEYNRVKNSGTQPNVFDQFDAPAPAATAPPQDQPAPGLPAMYDDKAKALMQQTYGFNNAATNGMFGEIGPKLNSGMMGLLQGGLIDPAMGRGFHVADRYNEDLGVHRDVANNFSQQNPGEAAAAGLLGMAVGASKMPSIGSGILGAAGTAAAYGGLLGAADDASSLQDRAWNVAKGGVIGGLLGGGAGLAAKGLGRAISPFRITPENVAATNLLKQNGVDLTAGQITGNKGLLYRESELGGKSAQDFMDRQNQQFTGAALGKIGENATAATPEVMQKAYERIGGQFDTLAAKSQAVNDSQLSRDVIDTLNSYTSQTADSNRVPYIRDLAKDILQRDNITGDWYQNTRSQLGKFAKSADPQTADAAYSLQNALDGAFERSNPQQAAEWQQARSQYRNYLVLERASTGAGQNAANGYISPAQLRQATVGVQGRRSYAHGKGDFADLARAGVQLMTPLPNSGTASRLAARVLPNLLGGLGGAAYGHEQGGTAGAVAGLLAGAAGPALLGRLLLSPMGRSYLANGVAAKTTPLINNVIDRFAPTAGLLGNQFNEALSQ